MIRRAFTLVEMLIAVALLAVIMIFLYQSVATLQRSNTFYGEKLETIIDQQQLYKTIFLDLSLSIEEQGEILNQSRDKDVVLMQTSHVVHNHIMAYIAYFIKEKHLYRIESYQRLKYPFESNLNVQIDDFGPMKTFRLYKNKTHFLLHTSSDGNKESLLKIRHLN